MREMKDSGIEWIGLTPSMWANRRIKYVIKSRDSGLWGQDVKCEENGTICLRIADFDYSKGIFKDTPVDALTYRKYPSYVVDKCHLKKGDILIEKSGGGEKTPVGRTVLFDKPYIALFANFMDRIRVNTSIVMPQYLQYWFRAFYSCKMSPYYINQTTGIQNINLSRLLTKEKVFYPSLKDQKAIVSFLDIKCSEIDAISADIQKEIEILEQYKKSVIFEAVSKGNCKVTRVKSGSKIWAEIPLNWKLVDVKYIFEIVKRIAGREGYDILSVTQKGLKVKDISDNKGQIAENYSGYQFVFPYDYVMNHMDLVTGWVDCSDKFGVTSPDYRVFRLKNKSIHDTNYFKYVMQCCYMCRIFYSLGQGVSTLGRWRLQTSTFMNFKIPVPPYNEQKGIAAYLDTKCKEIESAIADKKHQLEVLSAYKKSIIYEYVTGKKEVPNYG